MTGNDWLTFNMSPLVSFLLPSRGRVDRLLRAIQSFHATAANKDTFDVRVKLDDDDETSLSRKGELEQFGNVHVMVAPRLKGYHSIDHFVTLMAMESPAPWVWVFNDDATLIGKGWDEQIATLPTVGIIVHPEIHKLHTSVYYRDHGGPCPCVPNGCWTKWVPSFPSPSDTELNQLLIGVAGWNTHYLKGITVWHQRDHERVLAEHRKL